MAICETCDYANRPPYKSPCSECDKTMGSPFCCYEHEENPTNADRIRAMSDEELAEFLVTANPTNCLECAFSFGWRCQPDRQDYSDTEKCVEGKKRWLKQPAEGE